MLSWSSSSLAVAMVAVGALSPCFMPVSARAGDKIEFSAPSASLEVPQVAREEAPLPSFNLPMRTDDRTPEDVRGRTVYVVTTPRQNGLRAWDSDDTDDQDDAYPGSGHEDRDRRNDELYSSQRAVYELTNRWDDARDRDFESIFSHRRRQETASEGHFGGQAEAEKALGRIDYEADKRYASHFGDSGEDLTWSRQTLDGGLEPEETARKEMSAWADKILHPASHEIDRTLARQQRFTQMRGVNRNSLGEDPSEDSFSVADSLPPGSTLSPATDTFATQWNDKGRRMPEETPRAPLNYKYDYTNTVGQYSDLFSRQQPPASPPGQVQSRPAILPFPKKPGSVF
ncbi:MAG: hypothetical protein ACLQU4_10185 [Limisphaerales bacterium]